MAHNTSRFLNRRGGSVPLSPFHTWIPINTAIMAANPTNKPITTELFHACSVPPHCSASNRHTTAGTSTAVPSKSKLNTLCNTVNPSVSPSPSRLICKNRKIANMAAPPIGKFTQKHHRQVT
jgi:hypothetical protein